MRKMTKMAVTLAAMSAMTVAAASMAFAAEDGWSGDDNNGWSYTKDGAKIKNAWAEIDGVWYYFDGDKAAQDTVLYIDGDSYYFDANGTLATGWQKITSKMDAYSDIEIPEDLYYNKANSYVDVNDAYDYEDFVWCYFDEHGVAAENEWFHSPDSGLWYYFDENVMVKNLYNYEINPDNADHADSSNLTLYGFDKNGAMLTGWNYKEGSKTWNDPTADDAGRTWYYYGTSGKMQKAGWKLIDDEWYLFANYTDTGSDAQEIGYPLIVNSFIHSNASATKTEYFYVNKDGKMQTGVTTIPKKAWEVTFYVDSNKKFNVEYEKNQTANETIEVNLGSNGAAKEAAVDKKYYTMEGKYIVKFDDGLEKVNNSVVSIVDDTTWNWSTTTESSYAVTGSAFTFTDDFVVGELVKNAFIAPAKDTLYLADKNGDFVTSKAVLIDDNAGIIVKDKNDKDVTYNNAYILFGNNGKAQTGYTGKNKSITVGGTTYWATNYNLTLENGKVEDVTVFVSNKTK